MATRRRRASPARVRAAAGVHQELSQQELSSGAFLRVSNSRAALTLLNCEDGWSAVSSAVLNGGYRSRVEAVLNTRTSVDYDGMNPEPVELIRRLSENEGFNPEATVGLMTAASMQTLRTASRAADGVIVDVIVTCGFSNARAAGADADFFGFGDDDDEHSPSPPGTINTIGMPGQANRRP